MKGKIMFAWNERRIVMYTIDNLIDKLIKIEEEGSNLYLIISESVNIEKKLQIMAKILSDEEKKHIIIYEEFKKNSTTYDNIEVELATYDRAVGLIYEFSKIKTRNSIKNVRELFKFALIFEKENLALVLIILGLFVKSHEDINSKNYMIVSEIVKEEQKHVNLIEDIIKRYSII
ncbi:hypothetical protein [Clostridium psychrophilum]|uniref:hypothetical protein n=1 Tax=Clostridium psychrophilum TaxID=132926 RepID=UPI001C0B79DB|nr:hypothetical protein [Clostridium psychrophilum]MBU3180729.1 hypothetical protein [Clostridium psychrophilum]